MTHYTTLVQRCRATNSLLADDLATEFERMERRPPALKGLREVLNDADDALDKDTCDQKRLTSTLPDDAEVVVTAGTLRKIGKLFSRLDTVLID